MTNNDLEVFGAKIKDIRKKRGFTQEQLSEMVSCSNTFICYIEKGKKCVSLDMFIDIANALNVSADELLHEFLENTIAVSNHQFAAITADCSTYEMRILLDLLTTAKQSLRENRGLFRP